jgi:hypothetical protein
VTITPTKRRFKREEIKGNIRRLDIREGWRTPGVGSIPVMVQKISVTPTRQTTLQICEDDRSCPGNKAFSMTGGPLHCHLCSPISSDDVGEHPSGNMTFHSPRRMGGHHTNA